MGNTCCACAENKEPHTIESSVLNEHQEPTYEKEVTISSLAYPIRSISIHESKQTGHIHLETLNNISKKKSIPSGLEVKHFDSLKKMVTNFKVEPSNFRCEQKKETLASRYDIEGTIGQGSFGEVKRIKEKGTGQIGAIKIIGKANCQQTDTFADEIEIIKKLVNKTFF